MSTKENKEFVRRYLDAINGKAKSAAVANQYIAESDELLKQHIAGFEAAFPLYALLVQDMIAEDDKVVVRFIFHGTQKGEFMGIPATGKEVNMPGIIIYRLANGKIAEHWMQVDTVTLMQQLGVRS